MTTCPPVDKLRQLLDETLGDAEHQDVEAHVEMCPACQEKLATLTETTQPLAPEVPAHASTLTRPQYQALLSRIKQHPPAANGTSTTAGGARDPQRLVQWRETLQQQEQLQILEELGTGGFGVVYKAFDRQLQQAVALKVLHAELAEDVAQRSRFEREARKAAAVRHDHVVTVYRLGCHEGIPFIVMELIDGEPLNARLQREKKLAPRSAVDLVRQVALGLAAAHGQNVVHRDVKTANILLDRRTGRAKITDFGIALDLTGAATRLTKTDQRPGTLEYMGPEQLQTVGKVDGRSDLYSLGVVLYELLTGERPFRGLTHLVIQQVLREEPRPPRHLDDHIPRDLETIALKCLAKEPAARYQSATELAEDLERFLQDEPIRARPASRWERTYRWVRRHPAEAALRFISGVAAVALVTLTVSLLYSGEMYQANQQLESMGLKLQDTNGTLTRQKEALETSKDQLLVANRESEQLRYDADMAVAHQAWHEGDVRRAAELVEALKPVAGQPDYRGFEWYYLKRLLEQQGQLIGQAKGAITNLAVIPDRRPTAAPGSSVLLVAIRAWEGSQRQLWLWSPTGRRDDPWEQKLLLQAQPSDLLEWAVTRDGRFLATSHWDQRQGTLSVWELPLTDHSQPRYRRAAHMGPITALGFSPDGRYLASAGVGASPLYGKEYKFPPRDPTSKGEKVPFPESSGKTPGVMPSGPGKNVFRPLTEKELILSNGNRKIGLPDQLGPCSVRVWDVNTGSPVGDPLPLVDPVLALAFHPRENRLALAVGRYAPEHKFLTPGNREKRRGEVLLWEDFANSRHDVKLVGRHADIVRDVAFSPDGQRLATASDDVTVKVWAVEKGRTPTLQTTLDRHKLEVLTVAFNAPVGDYLASAGWDKTIRIWNAPLGKELQVLSGHQGVVTKVVFLPDDPASGGTNPTVPRTWRLAAGDSTGAVRLWQIPIDQASLVLPKLPQVTGAPATTIYDAAFLGDQRLLAVDANNRYTLWDIPRQTGEAFPSLGDRVDRLFVGPAGRYLALVSNNHVEVRTVGQPGTTVFQADHKEPIVRVVFSHGDKRVATWTNNQVKVWHLEPFRAVLDQPLPVPPDAVAIDPTGQHLAVARRDGRVAVWDLAKRAEVLVLQPPSVATAAANQRVFHDVAFRADGKFLAAGRQDFTVQVWDIPNRRALKPLKGHMCFVSSVAFSPDGKRLVTGSEDRTVKIWDLGTGMAILTLRGHSGRVTGVTFRSDGQELASTSEDGTIRLWAAPRP